MVEIREARAEDLASIKGLALRAWLRTYRGIFPEDEIRAENEKFYTPGFHGLLLERTREGLHVFLVAVEGTVVVGLADFDFDGDQSWLMRLYVEPQRIGQRLGHRLLGACEAELVRRGRREYRLLVHGKNGEGIAFYERRGLVRDPAHDRPEDGELCYLCRL